VIPAPRPMSDPANVPALVLTCGRRAVVLHPDGPEHENAVAARARLERRGYTVAGTPANWGPFLAGAPPQIRALALQILAGGAGEVAA